MNIAGGSYIGSAIPPEPIKPCPFCGDFMEYSEYGPSEWSREEKSSFYVAHSGKSSNSNMKCLLMGSLYSDIAAWNKRANALSILSELRDYLIDRKEKLVAGISKKDLESIKNTKSWDSRGKTVRDRIEAIGQEGIKIDDLLARIEKEQQK